jgi:multidrug efflux pump
MGVPFKEFDRIFSNVGNPTVAQANVVYRTVDWDERKRSTMDMARELQPKFNALPGVTAFPITLPSLGQGFRERPLNFVIQTSESYENLNTVVEQMLAEIDKNPGIVSSNVDLRLNKPELCIDVARDRAADLGVSVDAVAKAIETLLGGRNVTRYRRDADQYDVIFQVEAGSRSTPEAIERIYVRGQKRGVDAMIPLSSLVKVSKSVSPRELNHFGQRHSGSITVSLAGDYSIGEALNSMDQTAAKALKTGDSTELNGISRDVQEFKGRASDCVCAGTALHFPGAGRTV